MDAKITLSFNKDIIQKAKIYAESQNISLSRLMELLLDKITTNKYTSLEDFPISDWVNSVSEGAAEYKNTATISKKRKAIYRSRKK
jgi:hypothetical protein